ncbi:hypothetical protein O9992_02925 [Vibrio lentus]|nr:hypothetical protein [Vibrio lentus]
MGGNTGALMALSRFRLKLLPVLIGLHWTQAPAGYNGVCHGCLIWERTFLVSADSLFQFAVMGSALAEQHWVVLPCRYLEYRCRREQRQ